MATKATDNSAEYAVMVMGLQAAEERGLQAVEIFGDSQLIARQMSGQAEVKHIGFRQRFNKARDLIENMRSVTMTHTSREWNTTADFLANIAMNERASSKNIQEAGPESRSPHRQLQARMTHFLNYWPQQGGASRDEAKQAAAQ